MNIDDEYDATTEATATTAADRWKHLPPRVDPADYVESQPEDPPPSAPPHKRATAGR